MRPAIDASMAANGRRPWTEREDAFIRNAYAAYPPPQAIPLEDIGRWIDRSARAVGARAQELRLTSGKRGGARTLPDLVCPTCSVTFRSTSSTQRFCSAACGNAGQWDRNPHPRGATGHQFTDEQRAKISAAGRASWAARSDEERAAYIAPMLAGSEAARRNGARTAESTFTRGKGGRRADLDNRYFRSSWEANYARYLNWLIALEQGIASWEYEPVTFEFPVKRGTRFYTPDFRVWMRSGGYEWHEVKGWLTQQGATALRRFALHHPAEHAHLVMIDGDVYRPLAASVRALIPGWE